MDTIENRPDRIRRVWLLAGLLVATLVAGTLAAAGLPTRAAADDYVSHHEFQVNCPVSHTGPDDPIVYPGQPGAAHHHTFLGNRTTDAYSTTESLLAGTTTCLVPADRSAYVPDAAPRGHGGAARLPAGRLLQVRHRGLHEGGPLPAGAAVRGR